MEQFSLACKEWISLLVTGTQPLSIDNPLITGFHIAALRMNETLPVARIVVDASSSTVVYEIRLVDGRVWKQDITAKEIDAPIQFRVVGEWRRSEFSAQNPLQETIMRLITELGVVTIDARPSQPARP